LSVTPDHLRLLLVDDDPSQRDRLALTLERTGMSFELAWCAGEIEALDRIGEELFDLCFVDHLLETSNGVEFIRECTRRRIPTPIVMLTARHGRELAVEALDAGATDYLRKDGLDAEMLERTIRYALERSRIMRELRRNEERMRTTIAGAPIAIFTIDAEGIIRFAEGQVLATLGLTTADLVGHPVADRFGTNEAVMGVVRHALSGREFRGIVPIGETMLEVHATPRLAHDGAITGVVGVATDITARARAEQERETLLKIVEHERSRIESLVSGLPVVVWESIYGDDGQLHPTYVSDHIETLTGYTADEWLADPELWVRLVHPDDRALLDVSLEELGGGRAERRYRMIRRDGSIAWIDVRFSLTSTSTGTPAAMLGVALDVTEQVLAEERLQRSEKLFESFMNNSPILNFIKDRDGRYLFVNEAFSALVKRPAADVAGHTDPELWPAEVAAAFRRNDADVLDANRPLVFVERAFDDGREVISHVVKFPIHGADSHALLGGIAVDISARVAAEESLRMSEERFLLSSRATNDVVYDWDMRINAIWWNENLSTRFGYAPDVGGYDLAWWRRAVHPDDLGRVSAELGRAIARRAQTFSSEYRFARADGSHAFVIDRGCLVYDDSGAPVRMIGAMIDVTEQVEAGEELRRREEEYRRIVETAQEGIWVTDNRGVTTFVNATMARMLGHTIEEMLGTKFEEYLDDAARVIARSNKERRERGLAEQYDLRMLRSDGSQIWTIVSANPIVGRDGGLVGSLAMVTDITERKRADEAVRSSEEKFRRIVETAQEGIWMVDADDRTTFVNARMAAILGQPAGDLLGRTVEELVPAFEVRAMHDRMERRRRGISEHYELELERPDGERLWTLVAANPVFDHDRTYRGSLAMVTDITARRRAELALLDANDRLELRVQERTAELAATMQQLEKAHQAQKRFVADASHDLRTPLTVVRAELDLLLAARTHDEATRQSIERAVSEIRRLDRLASDLLALATIDSPDAGGERHAARLDELLLESISNLTPIARERGITWNIVIDDAVETTCNREALLRALANVLENALKYSPRDTAVDVRFGRIDDEARIVVADSGIGIAPEDLPRIYDRFYRSDAARSTPGTGLGLPIVKSVVEAHGGSITIDSTQGSGTTVTIMLPIVEMGEEVKVG
jgi:PAS domain S-box-containing protein